MLLGLPFPERRRLHALGEENCFDMGSSGSRNFELGTLNSVHEYMNTCTWESSGTWESSMNICRWCKTIGGGVTTHVRTCIVVVHTAQLCDRIKGSS